MFASLIDLTAWCLFQNKAAMKTAGWTVKFSTDGITGPASGADTTDRWVTQANVVTRATIAGAAQSWIVLQNADGVQVLLAFQGATDDIARISYSPFGLFTLAGTTTFQPTASDEVVISVGNSLVNATLSADRVMSIWCSGDTKHWSFAIFRQSAIINILGVELVNNLALPPAAFGDGATARPYVGYRFLTGAWGIGFSSPIGPVSGIKNVAVGAATWEGCAARIFTSAASRITRAASAFPLTAGTGGASLTSGTGSFFLSSTPALQGSTPLHPLYWTGERIANLDGFVGYPIDWWLAMTASASTPGLSDFIPGYEPADVPGVSGGQTGVGDVRTNWLVSLGAAMVRPWRNASAALEIA